MVSATIFVAGVIILLLVVSFANQYMQTSGTAGGGDVLGGFWWRKRSTTTTAPWRITTTTTTTTPLIRYFYSCNKYQEDYWQCIRINGGDIANCNKLSEYNWNCKRIYPPPITTGAGRSISCSLSTVIIGGVQAGIGSLSCTKQQDLSWNCIVTPVVPLPTDSKLIGNADASCNGKID